MARTRNASARQRSPRPEFPIEQLGRYRYTLEGAIDHQKSWQHDFAKKVEAHQDVSLNLLADAELGRAAARRPQDADRISLLDKAGYELNNRPIWPVIPSPSSANCSAPQSSNRVSFPSRLKTTPQPNSKVRNIPPNAQATRKQAHPISVSSVYSVGHYLALSPPINFTE